jgi:type I restriction enzyme S subunit
MKTDTIGGLEIEIIDGDRGINYPSEGNLFKDGYCLFLNAKNVTKNGMRFDEIQFITHKRDNLLRNGKLNREDFILTTRGTVGNFGYYDKNVQYEHMRINSGMVILRNNNKDISNTYLNHFFNSEILEKQIDTISSGSAQPQLTVKTISSLKVSFPENISTQNKIAKILSTCDGVIEKTEAAIAKYKSIKQGMMLDLFNRGIDLSTGKLRPKYEDAPELYKESELGWIPKEWEVKRLEEIAGYVDYRGKTPPKSDKGIYLVTAKNIKFGYIDYEISKEYIPISSYEITMSRGKTKIGDVLITTEAPMGNVAQIDVEGLALAQRVIKYRCTEGVMLNDYLKNTLLSAYFQRELVAESTGSTVMGIKGSRLHKLKVLVPLIQEQEDIIKRFSPIEKKIKIEQSTLTKYRQIKAGLMQDLLSGKVEVKVSEK